MVHVKNSLFFDILGASRRKQLNIGSFVDHLAYSIFKMYSFLILVVLCLFATIYPKCMFKSHLFSRF